VVFWGSEALLLAGRTRRVLTEGGAAGAFSRGWARCTASGRWVPGPRGLACPVSAVSCM
jgi:hypothetical protein